MGVPDYETLMRPTLAVLASGQPQTRSQIRDVVAADTGIDDADLAEMLPSGKATVFGSRVGWALTETVQAGLATRPKRGVYVITDRGLKDDPRQGAAGRARGAVARRWMRRRPPGWCWSAACCRGLSRGGA